MSNKEGSVTINTAGATISTTGKNAPKEVRPLSKKKFQKLFANALAIEPLQPQSFLLYFKSSTTDLQESSKQLLQEVIKAIKQRNSLDISIIGHADRTGSKSYNITLSTKRAKQVSDLLVNMGINPQYLFVDSHGEGNPLIPTADNISEPKNRRVEIIVK